VFKKLAALGCLTTAIPILAIVVGALIAGDVAARHYAAAQIADRISAAVPEASGVHGRIRSFPFLGRLLFTQSVPEVGAHVDRLAGIRGVVFTDLDVDLRGVALDTHTLVSKRQVRLTHIKRGTVTVSLTQQALTDALGRQTRITGGAVNVAVLGGQSVRASIGVGANHQLTISASPLPALVVPLPSLKLLPCLPQATVLEGRIDLGCTFTTIPDAFVRAASATAA
jgi:DUF2993 family protein